MFYIRIFSADALKMTKNKIFMEIVLTVSKSDGII